jgi:hypothetical protein
MMTAGLLAALALPAPGVIELRGGALIEAPIESITLEGVRVGGPAPRVLSWDRVKVITGEGASEALEYEEIAGVAWRARTRLARGDAAMAEPLFAWLFNQYQSGDGPTAAFVADGHLRCLLDRGAQAEAVAPWLDTVRLDAAEPGPGGSGAGPLRPALAPIFDDSPATRALGESGLPARFQPVGGAAHALAWWYTEAARFDAGLPGQLATTRPSESGGSAESLALVEQIVVSRTGDRDNRQRARARLRVVVDHERGGWQEAWARVAIGRSMLLEQDETSRALGVVELLHVPARFSSEQPALAALALRDASRALRAAGDDAGSAALLRELPQIDPSRPAPAPMPASAHVSDATPSDPANQPDRSDPRPPERNATRSDNRP